MKINLGNLPAKSKAHLTIKCYMKLGIEDLSWCLRLPSTFTPRYIGNAPKYILTGSAQNTNPNNEIKGDGESAEDMKSNVDEFE